MTRAAVPAHRARAVEPNLDEPAHPRRKLTEQEFIDWCTDNTFAEWVDGEVILMTPISDDHDRLFGFISTLLTMYVDERELGRVLTEPFQIRFGRLRRRRSPDIMFVATQHLDRIKRINIEGAPDVAFEIVSRNSVTRDYRDKFNDYAAAGVKEYWIVDPLSETIQANLLSATKRYTEILQKDGRIRSHVIPGFYLRPQWLWDERRPKVLMILRELLRQK